MSEGRQQQDAAATRRRSTLRIGAGASYAGDRVEPATLLAEHGKLDYLVYETLAERTIALANTQRMKDPATGYNEMLVNVFAPRCRTAAAAVPTSAPASSPAWVRPTRSPLRRRRPRLCVS